MSQSRSSSGYRPDIDGLRCIAIVAVILFHVEVPHITGGFLGVDIFFVISGFLIGSHVYRETRDGTFSIMRFYERRAKRILPAFFVVLLISCVLGCLLLSGNELKRFSAQAIAAVASCSNIYFWLRAGYFAPKSSLNPLLMTWSLGVEEQFYIVFPLLMLLLRRFFARQLLAILGLLAMISLIISIFSVNHAPTAAFYLLPSRAWEIAFGCILGIYEIEYPNKQRTTKIATELLAVVGLTVIAACCFLYTEQTPFPGIAALLPVIGAVILIRTKESWVNRSILSAKPLVSIGLVSYSLYLWHWPLLSFAKTCTGGALPASAAYLIALLALFLSSLTYFVIEQPFRRTRKRGPRLLMAYGIVSAGFAVIAFLLFESHGWEGRYPRATTVEEVALRAFPDKCLVDYGGSRFVSTPFCIPPEGTGTPIMALMGDSHASALAPELRSQSAEHGWLFYEFTKSSCAQLADVTRAISAHPSHAKECSDYNQAALSRVMGDPNIRTVLLSGFWAAGLPGSRGNGFVRLGLRDSDTPANEWSNFEGGLERVVRLLKSKKKEVIISTDVPRFRGDPLILTVGQVITPRNWLRGFLTRSQNPQDAEAKDIVVTPTDRYANQIIERVAGRTGARVVDVTQQLCDDAACTFSLNGDSLYVDDQHVSPLGAHIALLNSSLF